jgi:hypothetical protein
VPTAPILNLGARWKSADVYWNTSAANASLLGVNQLAKRGPEVNFAQQTGIYVLYAAFAPLYVGQANGSLWARLHEHMFHDDLAERWDRFTWLGFRRVVGGKAPYLSKNGASFHMTSRQLLDHLEAALIHTFEPSMNGQEGRFGKAVIRYKQLRDPRLGPSDRELVESMAVQGDMLPPGTTVTARGWRKT